MKKIIALFIFTSFAVTAYAQSSYNIGVNFGFNTNLSKFTSGMNDADALFTKNPYCSAVIGVSVRKAVSSRFSLQTGFDFTEFGFSYALAQDYSLTKEEDHYAELRTGTCMTKVPVIGIYNSKLNCRNIRFIAGAGFALAFIDNKWESENSKTVEGEVLGNTGTTTMKQTTHSTTDVSGSFITLIGIEKVYARGNMFSLTLQGNYGFAPVAESTVTYTVNDKKYNHTFSNNGSFCSFTLSYYFLPLGSRKLNQAVTPPKR